VNCQSAVQVLQTATGLVRLLVAHSLSAALLPASAAATVVQQRGHDDDPSSKDRVVGSVTVTQLSSPAADQPADMVVRLHTPHTQRPSCQRQYE